LRDELAAKLAMLKAGQFDARYYLNECISAGVSEFLRYGSLLDHYVLQGWRLGLDPSEEFSVEQFLAANPAIALRRGGPAAPLARQEEAALGQPETSGEAWQQAKTATGSKVEPSRSSDEPEGFVDYLSDSRAIGWAWLPGKPDETVTIAVSLGGAILLEAPAGDHRPELMAAGKGNGRYGFDLSFKSGLAWGEFAVEAVYGRSRSRLRIGKLEQTALERATLPPTTATQTTPATSPGELASEADSFQIRGGVDQVTSSGVSGWVYAPSYPNATLQVEVQVEDYVVGRGIADQLREDLRSHGVGSGRYGFYVKFTRTLPPGARPRLSVSMITKDELECPEPVASEHSQRIRDASMSTAENLIAEHHRFTSPGPDFEEHDAAVISGMPTGEARPLLMAFYLPQFHTIPENDSFWGKGFTEWRQLPRALSRFPGHYQPRIPRDLGFYNLTSTDDIRRQVEMATASGIGAFAFYYYWFNGRRVLEQPLDLFVESKQGIDFLLIWANENWTRTWDGSENQVLLKQDYLEEDEPQLLANLAGYFAQKNYVRINGRPLFFVYNPGAVPETRKTILRWRATLSMRHGIEPLFFMCQTFGQENPYDFGFDGAMEFPPHKLSANLIPRIVEDAYSPDYSGRVYSYDDFVAASCDAEQPDFPLIKTAFPAWDNDPRRPNRGFTLDGIAPQKFENWLTTLLDRASEKPIFGRPIVAVNAWNEWAEGAYLEPDVYYGSAFLNAAARALRSTCEGMSRASVGSRKKVSVIVPNYNHAHYMPDRLGSLLAQTVPPDEIIFLDDCSADDSLTVAASILQAGNVPYTIVPNQTNSGCVFRQWIKGIDLAANELVWIAESDDSVEPDFLERLLPAFDKPEVMIAFGHIQYIDANSKPNSDLDGYFNGFEHFSWHKSTVVPAYKAFQRDFTLRNIIPNASGAVFHKPRLTAAEIERLYEYRFAGDWYFYALVLRGGAIALRHRARSLFRIGQSSASRSKFSTDTHRREHAMVLEDISALYAPSRAVLKQHIELLSAHFPDMTMKQLVGELLPRPGLREGCRRLRICIAAHSFDIGGGELLPLELANALKGRGHHITYLVIESPQLNATRSLLPRLRPDIPIVYWESICKNFEQFIFDYGIELLNSHNVSIESHLHWSSIPVRIPYVASLHGGYENAPGVITPEFSRYVAETVGLWLYLGQKNIAMLLEAGVSTEKCKRSFNALSYNANLFESRHEVRTRYGLDNSTFVLVQCSRAIHAKGWQTAIDATKSLHSAKMPVHLMLIGDGPDLLELREKNNLPFVTFLGHVDRPQRLLAAFDIGVFPSVYVGETFPLFLLECFQAGLPVVATDIGEIGYMMGERKSEQPGTILSHREKPGTLTRQVAKAIRTLLSDEVALQCVRENATRASERFSMDRLVAFYEENFSELIARSSPMTSQPSGDRVAS
jgi:glycosyltransferase involved in cell wall biosynthesis/GT2 family glycosyltransferase